MDKKVVIIGGGVAGLSAAHELIKRGYQVEVHELKKIPGGKARSTDVPDSSTQGRKPLPGEHGFRFFPRFYRHVTQTMKEIPLSNGKTVFDNLVETTEIRVARFGEPSFYSPAKFPGSWKEIRKFLDLDKGVDLGLSEKEKDYFTDRLWQLMTSSYERRQEEYEKIGWWEFIEADQFSDAYKTFLARGLTRTLVAARAETVSSKTGGDILLQLMFDILKPGTSSDRILNGPTNDVWIDPWLEYLKKNGIDYRLNSKCLSINCDTTTNSISSVTVEIKGDPVEIKGDYYISCVPVEVMAELLNKEMLQVDPVLKYIRELAPNVSWMNGLQLYLKRDVKINHGHCIYVDTPWALTSISQTQFWNDFNWDKYGDGEVKGVISIDVSDWFSPGVLFNKAAKDCTPDEVIKEVWEQLKRSLNIDGETILKDEDLHAWNIDNSIVPEIPAINKEPLLVNNANTWPLRPNAFTRIDNFFLAADYVKTNTDLATMEGANEAARRAVNSILDKSGYKGKKCRVWKLHEPRFLTVFRWVDRRRYEKGMPWKGDFPPIFKIIDKLNKFFSKIF